MSGPPPTRSGSAWSRGTDIPFRAMSDARRPSGSRGRRRSSARSPGRRRTAPSPGPGAARPRRRRECPPYAAAASVVDAGRGLEPGPPGGEAAAGHPGVGALGEALLEHATSMSGFSDARSAAMTPAAPAPATTTSTSMSSRTWSPLPDRSRVVSRRGPTTCRRRPERGRPGRGAAAHGGTRAATGRGPTVRYCRARISATWRSVPSESSTGTSSTRLRPWSARNTLSGPSPGTMTVAPASIASSAADRNAASRPSGCAYARHDVGEVGGDLTDRPDDAVEAVGRAGCDAAAASSAPMKFTMPTVDPSGPP